MPGDFYRTSQDGQGDVSEVQWCEESVCHIDFVFGVALGKKVLTLADNLSKSLQAEALSASKGQAIAQSTVNALLKLRNEEKFAEFWKDVLTIPEANDVSVPQLPRKRKVPARHQETAGEPHFPVSVEDHYHPIYFSSIDTVVQAIQQRFDQDGYRQYKQLEELLFMGCRGQFIAAELQNVKALYKGSPSAEREPVGGKSRGGGGPWFLL